MTTYMFPGQGSQFKGMGEGLFDEFKELTAKANSILDYSIRRLCLEDRENRLGNPKFTQPALFTVNAMMHLKKTKEKRIKPDYVLGHSLGEYSALFAADVFDFETGLHLVQKRAELMSQATGGAMAAVIGLSGEDIQGILEEHDYRTISLANCNTPSQVVISGPRKDIEKAQVVFEQAGAARYVVLPVSGAFHSPHMAEVKKRFASLVEEVAFETPSIPVISNAYARPYEKKYMQTTLIEQIVSPVKWQESIQYLMGCGETSFEEVGPGITLTGIVKQIPREITAPRDGVERGALDVESQNANKSIGIASERKSGMDINRPRRQATDGNERGKEPGHNKGDALGSADFKKDYQLKYAYYAGGMYKGIASKELVVRMGKSGMMAYYGSGGVDLKEVEKAIAYIQRELTNGEPYGCNLIHHFNDPEAEEKLVDIYIRHGVRNIEAAAYMALSRALVRYRVSGLSRALDGSVIRKHKIVAKMSRPEVAEIFLSPAPDQIVQRLAKDKVITEEQATLAKETPMADHLCIEADSGGHTDRGIAYTLMPTMLRLRDAYMARYGYSHKIAVGAAGGIGTPEAAAAAVILGAEFLVTGSINQCTVEAGTSELVKEMLAEMNVQDTDYAPAGDMFELGAYVQVFRKGVLFPGRANKLYQLYRRYDSINELDDKTRRQLQEKYFKRSFSDIYDDCKKFYSTDVIKKAEKNPKQKMALIFRWYFGRSTRLALTGKKEDKVNFQIQCGPALGAFNSWVRGTELQDWRKRHVDRIGLKLLNATAELLEERFEKINNCRLPYKAAPN
jgi:trans-AT polyketide synthase, acyltransferase and oxidoreductase domains